MIGRAQKIMKRRLLFVDDKLAHRETAGGRAARELAEELERRDVEVVEAVTYLDGEAVVVSDATIDCIFLDWNLGTNDTNSHEQALELLRTIRKRNTAIQLRSGALPVPLVLEEERAVGPSLGADSIRDGVHASLLGAGLVFVFMAIYYSVTGMFANLALIVNVVILIGLMSATRATMTLPGIAGVVLTVGMAVDSNVIIYERIREELRRGKTARAAIQEGYGRSFWTIFDAHVTALLSSIILVMIGRGPVQGFGVTLTIGLIASMFTALVVTRTLMDTVYGTHPERLRI